MGLELIHFLAHTPFNYHTGESNEKSYGLSNLIYPQIDTINLISER